MSSPRSVRFEAPVLARLDRYLKAHPGSSISGVANLFVDEALRSYEHPGIMFRPGPTGRRAALVGGPDIWEVIVALHAVRAEDPSLAQDALVAEVAHVTGLTPEQIRIAVRYYAAYPEEIDDRIALNDAETEELSARSVGEQRLLGAGERPHAAR